MSLLCYYLFNGCRLRCLRKMVYWINISYNVTVDENCLWWHNCYNCDVIQGFLINTGISFIFNTADFVTEGESVDKEVFYQEMVGEGIEDRVANAILVNLTWLGYEVLEYFLTFIPKKKVLESSDYSPAKVVTLEITMHIRPGDIWEQNFIQESFDTWNDIPKPATQDAINSLENIFLMEDRSNEDEEKNICVICQEEFVREQILLKFPCTHEYHSNCLRTWLERKHECPCCRYKLDF